MPNCAGGPPALALGGGARPARLDRRGCLQQSPQPIQLAIGLFFRQRPTDRRSSMPVSKGRPDKAGIARSAAWDSSPWQGTSPRLCTAQIRRQSRSRKVPESLGQLCYVKGANRFLPSVPHSVLENCAAICQSSPRHADALGPIRGLPRSETRTSHRVRYALQRVYLRPIFCPDRQRLAPMTRCRGTPDPSRPREWLANDLMVEYYAQRSTTPGTLLISEAL